MEKNELVERYSISLFFSDWGVLVKILVLLIILVLFSIFIYDSFV